MPSAFHLPICGCDGELPDGEWMLVESIASKSVALSNQPRGKPLEYKVVAMNKSGDGAESNTVVVIL